jgi:hypothetical protein
MPVVSGLDAPEPKRVGFDAALDEAEHAVWHGHKLCVIHKA